MKKEMKYLVDYDLPAENGRRQFYRYLKRILKSCNWTKSSNSVILVDDLSAAYAVVKVARACNAQYANVYKVIPMCHDALSCPD